MSTRDRKSAASPCRTTFSTCWASASARGRSSGSNPSATHAQEGRPFVDGRNLQGRVSGVVEQGERPIRVPRHTCQRDERPVANLWVIQVVCHLRRRSRPSGQRDRRKHVAYRVGAELRVPNALGRPERG